MYVEYNGVILERAFTESWEEQVVYDPSGVNMIGNKILMTFQGNVYPDYNTALPQVPFAGNWYDQFTNLTGRTPNTARPSEFWDDGDVSTNVGLPISVDSTVKVSAPNQVYASFKERLNVVLRRLSIPRGDLYVYKWWRPDMTPGRFLPPLVGGRRNPQSQDFDFIFRAYGQNEDDPVLNEERLNVDVNNGPKPIAVKIIQKTDVFAVISFTIEVTKIRCLKGETYWSEPGLDGRLERIPTENMIVSHRVWTEEAIDSHFYTTRTTYGKIRITNANKSAHWYREAWKAPLEDGFRRESVRFSESEDGMTLSYTVTDRQVQNAAPFPATSFNGNIAYSVVNNAEMSLQMTISLVGRVDSPRDALVTRALQAITAKLRSFAHWGNGFVNRFTVSENLEDPPTITANMSAVLYFKNKESKEAPTERELTNLYIPLINLMGQGVEFNKDFYYDRGTKLVEYDRRISASPSPYGYNAYVVTGIERDLDGEERVTWDISKRNDTAQFIRSLATAPCVLETSHSYNNATNQNSENNRLSTSVYQDDSVTNVVTQKRNTGITAQALTYPYTVYKSDITYDVDFKRVVLPQQSPEKYPSEIRAKIIAKQAELNELVASSEQPSQDPIISQDPIEPVNPVNIGGKITRLTNEIKALKRKLNNTRVVELARATPIAHIVIEAERVGRMPDMPSPNEVVTTQEEDEDDVITFTPIASKITHCDPIPAPADNRMVYKVLGVYDYAMSRHIRRNDKIWILSNPVYEGNAYPSDETGVALPTWALGQLSQGDQSCNAQIINEYSQSVLRSAYSGGQLNHKYARSDVMSDASEMSGWNTTKQPQQNEG